MAELPDEILRLTQAWYEYIGKDHHKDRDCHWYIETDFAYGGPPTYTASHYGYVGDYEEVQATNWYAANEALLFLIRKTIKKEQDWAREVLREPDAWNSWQVEKAEFILGVDIDG